jgi:hypothetical protein
MTGLVGCAAKAIAVGGLAATGALVAQDQFDSSLFKANTRTAITADAGTDSAGVTAETSLDGANGTGVDANVATTEGSASGGAGLTTGAIPAPDGTECSDNCLAPCVAGCANPEGMPTLDGAVAARATLGVPAAPEQSRGCPASDGEIGLDLEAEGSAATTGTSSGGLSGRGVISLGN